jgi:hypothetical protein
MINSATVEYLKLDLDLPLHLNAENNLGKTSLVNTLQFLYINYVNDMFLPSSVPESIRFYFRDEYSYLIFECVSKTGTHCVILNRPAGSSKYYNRHLIKCEYASDIFIDSKLRPRSWEDVLEKLSELNLEFASVTHKEWWRSLSGLTDNKTRKRKIPSLFILPVKDHESYKRFKMIYRNLLSMSSITLDTFKDILLSCAVASGEKRKIDFAEKDYKGTFEKCRNLQAQHQYYIEHEQEISEIREAEKSLQKFKRNMPARFCILKTNYDTYRKNLEREIDTAEGRKIKIKDEKKEQHELSSGFIEEQVKNAGNLKPVEELISEYERLEEDENLFLCRQKFSFEEFKKHKEDIERKFFNLEKDLEGIKEYTQDGLKDSIIRIQKNLDGQSQLLDNDRLLKWLQQEGVKNDDIHKLASLFRTELINTPMEKIKLKNKELLLQNITSITDKVSNNFYEDSAVKIEIEQKQFQKLTDQEETKKQIVGLQVELRKAKERLSLFLEQADKISDLSKLDKQRKANMELLKSYERFAELSSKLPALKSKASKFKNTQSELSDKIKLHKDNIDDLDKEFQELIESLGEKQISLRTLNGDYSSLEATVHQHFPDVISGEVEFEKEELELDFLLGELPVLKNQLEELTSKFDRLENKKIRIMKETGLTYDQEEDWKSFLNANINSVQAQERLNKEWQIFFGIAKHDFRSLVHCVDSISKLTKSIDRTFGRQKISNLSSIKISIETDELYQQAREFILESDDLFADPQRRRIYTGMLQAYFSKQYTDLRAEDFFHINIQISNLNNPSERKNITTFENESEGTNYTIKVLLLSQLLKEQFQHGLYHESIAFHYYLDEIGQLDTTNLSNIVAQNLEKKLIPITAAPRPVIDPLCHPECKVVTLVQDSETNATRIASENTFSAADISYEMIDIPEQDDNDETQ